MELRSCPRPCFPRLPLRSRHRRRHTPPKISSLQSGSFCSGLPGRRAPCFYSKTCTGRMSTASSYWRTSRESTDLPLLILGTYRPDELHRRHPLTELLSDLGRSRLYAELRLPALDREQLRAMLSAIFDGTEVGDEFVDAVFDRTVGNPFFVEELSKVLIDRGDVYRVAGDWERRELTEIAMPLTVREALLGRTQELTAGALNVLRLAAVAGERLDIPVLAEAAQVSTDEVEETVDQGLKLQLLVERHDGPVVRYAFRHASLGKLWRTSSSDPSVVESSNVSRRRWLTPMPTISTAWRGSWRTTSPRRETSTTRLGSRSARRCGHEGLRHGRSGPPL